MSSPESVELPKPERGRLATLVLSLVLFALVAPTLHWFDFGNSMEHIVVGTALESRRERHYAIPTLYGQARTRKPPLAAWTSMAGIREGTIERLGSTDRATRAAALEDLATEARWPAALGACLMVAAACDLAFALGGRRLALMTFLVASSNVLFLKHARLGSFDTCLGLYVAAANLCFVRMVLGRRTWGAAVLGGVCLGLALLAKGPPALVETVAPMAAVLLWVGKFGAPERNAGGREAGFLRRTGPALLVGMLLGLAIAAPWTVYMLRTVPDVITTWRAEATREMADVAADPPWEYVKFVWLMLPWTIFFLIGLIDAGVALVRRRRDPILVAFWLFVVPLAILWCFRERKDRYVVPLVGPAAILTASAALTLLANWKRRAAEGRGQPLIDRLIVIGQFAIVAFFALRVPVVGGFVRNVADRLYLFSTRLPFSESWVRRNGDELPVFSAGVAVACLVLFAGAIVVGAVLQRRRAWPVAVVTCVLALAGDTLNLYGSQSRRGTPAYMGDLADAIADRYPPAVPVYSFRPNHLVPPTDMVIYLNRIIRPVGSVEEFAAKPGPKVLLFMRRGEVEPVPPLPIEGAVYLATRKPSGQIWDGWYVP